MKNYDSELLFFFYSKCSTLCYKVFFTSTSLDCLYEKV